MSELYGRQTAAALALESCIASMRARVLIAGRVQHHDEAEWHCSLLFNGKETFHSLILSGQVKIPCMR